MIIMATHGHTGWTRWLVGSVAESVTRHAPCPVWLVRCQETAPAAVPRVQRVLVPLDLSASAEGALDFLRDWFGPGGASLVLFSAAGMDWLGAQDDIYQDVLHELRSRLEARAQALRAEGWQVEVHLEGGPAAQGILAQAEASAVDLIAMTSHGRSGPSRWFTGSVAEQVLRYAACPVVLVRQAPQEA
jgi:nucleotide-binding universal stress UspA family protein